MKILVTGGAGFLGSHLCDKLIAKGEEVICLDNFYTGSRKNVEHLINNKLFRLVQHDVVNSIHLKIDQIYNLACPASPDHYQKNPIKTVKTSVLGAINMLGLAKREGAKILQASTSEVYGDPVIHPQNESYNGNVNPYGPRACYDEGKRCAESLFYEYNKVHNVDTKIVRIFNTYGPRMQKNDGRVISNFIVQALKGDDMTIYGDGNQTRSFCYVDDLIDGLYKLMNNDLNKPVNIGNENEYTISEIAKIIQSKINNNSKIVYKDLPADDPTRRKPDITLAKEKLNWKPKINLELGIEKTIKHFKENL